MSSRDAFYITTPIYYVNGAPHIGHAYTSIAADTAARWNRLCGREVRFLTGTDEHGQKVLEAATARGMSPKEHCDDMVKGWRATMEKLQISFDRFIRTTDDDHEALVQSVLQKLYDDGEIYADDYVGWYLVKDEVFVTEKEKEERIASGELQPEHFRQIEERNYFFRMSKYKEQLVAHIEANPDFIQPTNRRNEVLGFLRKELGDLCISRPKARMSWGIELPFDDAFVTYVWFDALLNYLTGAGFELGGSDGSPWWPVDYQLIGKDILTTHSVYWTTMLLAMGVPLPQHIYAHGWWVSSDGRKMSKSDGNTIDVDLLVDSFGVDATRYFFLREIRFGADGGFSYDGFLNRYNVDLANDLGNLLHRGLTMTGKWLGGTVPEAGPAASELVALVDAQVPVAVGSYDTLQFKEALEAVFALVGAGNKYIDTMQPWALNKAGDTEALAVVMRDVLELCGVAAALLVPVMPNKAEELLGKLGQSPDDARALVQRLLGSTEGALRHLSAGTPIPAGDPLFPRFRDMPAAIAAQLAPPEPEGPPELPELDWIAFEDFAKVQLRVGKVLTAEDHPKADKLLVLTVDVGEARPRTICAGIKSRFAPADLVGRSVVVVVNLKPRKMRGIASEGMILAAGGKEVVDLLSVQAEPGEEVR
jgi:methionyl-tRNA synthetase